MPIKKTKPIALIISLSLLFLLSTMKVSAGLTATCSATKASPTCSVKFTQSRSDASVITTANVGETKGLWVTIAGYNPAYHTAYYVCENSGDPVLKTLPGAANQTDTGADWTFANAGKEKCYLAFFPMGTTPAADWSNATSSCQTDYVTVSAPSTPTCSASFSLANLTAPGTSNLTFNSSGADKLLGACTGPLPIPQGDYGLMSTSSYPFAFTATQTGTETCSFVPYKGATQGTACSASVVVSAGNTPCECTNGPFSGGSSCSGGYCDGCHCVYNGTKVNGLCGSSNNQSLSTAPTANLCSAGAASAVSGTGPWSWTCAGTGGGTTASCSATKSGGTGACGTAANSNYACSATQTTGTLCTSGVTCYPNAGYPPSPCPTNIQLSGNQAHWYCGTDQNCYANKLSSCTTPACTAETTCVGNSCNDGTNWIVGTKTQGCATVSATANPASVNAPGSSFIKWTSSGASKVEAACLAGPVIINRGGWFTSDAECKNSGLVTECTDRGYEFKFSTTQTGTEVCTFYPTNSSDGQPGTPFTLNIVSTSGNSTCGNGTLDSGEDCDGPNHPCSAGKTCQSCKCITSTGIDGKCGTAATTYSSTDTGWNGGNFTFCETGQADPASPAFPAVGGFTTWKCKGSGGGADSTDCKATRTSGTPTANDWAIRFSADPALGNLPLKVKFDSGWTKTSSSNVSVSVTKQDCGAAGVSPTNNSYSSGGLKDSFECNYTSVGAFNPSITYKDNANNEKTAATKVEATNTPVNDDCSWSAGLSVAPQKNDYAIGEEIKASLYLNSGSLSDYTLTNPSCGTSSVSPKIINSTSFSCTYSKAGAYYIAATAKKNSGCAKDTQPFGVHIAGAGNENTRVCKPDNPNCVQETCKNYYCWDGCTYIRGTSNNCD